MKEIILRSLKNSNNCPPQCYETVKLMVTHATAIAIICPDASNTVRQTPIGGLCKRPEDSPDNNTVKALCIKDNAARLRYVKSSN